MLQSNLRNHLLSNLNGDDFALLQPYLHPVELDIKTTLESAGMPIEHAFFPDRGIASVVAIAPSGWRVEIGVVGREGMTGLALLLGENTSPNETLIQLASRGCRVPADDLRSAIAKSKTLLQSLLRYAHAFLIQTSRTALVNGSAKIEERLARWLLMLHDRTDGNKLELTHEFLATMLGVRRPGVTTAVHMLEYRGLIDAQRGEITIIDREGLIALTAGIYGLEEQRFADA